MDNDQEQIDTRDGVEAKLPTSLSDAYRKKMGRLVDLSKEQEDRLKKWLKKHIKAWKDDTVDLHKRLEEDNELVESITYETDFPWEGASSIHVQMTETYMDVFKSVEKRSILGSDVIWYGETDDDALQDELANVEEMMNFKARNEWGIEKALADVFWTTNRDGLGIIQDTWCEEYEKVNDIIMISSPQEFQEEFPDPVSAGVKDEEYIQLKAESAQATQEMPLEIPVTYEKQKYFGNKYDVIDLIDFVIFPAWAPHIKHESCRGYGKRFTLHKETIRRKMKDEVFYEEETEKLLKKDGDSRGNDPYTVSKDWIEGIKRTDKKEEYELYELVIKGSLDGEEGEQGRYLVTYSEKHDMLIQCMEYFYREDMYSLFWIDSRPNRLVGKSIPWKTRDANDEVDTQHNQRINSRTISDIPTFKAHSDLKSDPNFDPEAKENKWKPGRVFWSQHPELFDQFKIQPTDLGGSLQEEANTMKLTDLRLGSAAQLLSGGTAPDDPSAPGNKTEMMIAQSNLRMEDPLEELRGGVSDLGNISLSHLYQFGQSLIPYRKTIKGQGKIQGATISKKILRSGIKLKMKGITVINNPDFEMKRLIDLYVTMMQNIPEFAQNAQARIGMWRDALRAGRIQGRDRYLPTVEEVQAQQVELQKQAMMKMQAEQAAQKKAQQEAMVADNLKRANQELSIKSTARKLAESNMAEGAPPEAVSQPAPTAQ